VTAQNLEYKPFSQNVTLSSDGGELLISQIPDRNFNNPA
jgi:hypothetical protein